MIGLNELYGLVAENEQKMVELQAENRVLNKLVDIEKLKCVEQTCEESVEEVVDEVVEETAQQVESY